MAQNEIEKEENKTWWEKNKNTIYTISAFSVFIIAILYLWFHEANKL